MFNNLIYIKYNVVSIRNQTWSEKGRLSVKIMKGCFRQLIKRNVDNFCFLVLNSAEPFLPPNPNPSAV